MGATATKNAKSTLKLQQKISSTERSTSLSVMCDDIDTLSKTQLTKSPAQLAKLSSDIFRQSAEAKSCLGQLPTSEVQLDNTSKFLSQVGDYTYVLSQSMINGEEISQEEYDNLASMNEYAATLKNTPFGNRNKNLQRRSTAFHSQGQDSAEQSQTRQIQTYLTIWLT